MSQSPCGQKIFQKALTSVVADVLLKNQQLGLQNKKLKHLIRDVLEGDNYYIPSSIEPMLTTKWNTDDDIFAVIENLAVQFEVETRGLDRLTKDLLMHQADHEEEDGHSDSASTYLSLLQRSLIDMETPSACDRFPAAMPWSSLLDVPIAQKASHPSFGDEEEMHDFMNSVSKVIHNMNMPHDTKAAHSYVSGQSSLAQGAPVETRGLHISLPMHTKSNYATVVDNPVGCNYGNMHNSHVECLQSNLPDQLGVPCDSRRNCNARSSTEYVLSPTFENMEACRSIATVAVPPVVPMPMGSWIGEGPNTTASPDIPWSSGVQTLYVRNVPARLTCLQLLKLWPSQDSYNLLYVPFSHEHRRPIGALINFISHSAAAAFKEQWQGRNFSREGGLNKGLDVCVAVTQGLANNLWFMKCSKKISTLRNPKHQPTVIRRDGAILDFKQVIDSMVHPSEFDEERWML